MIGGLFAAWLFLSYRPDFVFLVAGIAVGTHHAVFATVYGDRSFWVLGAIITAVSLLAIFDIIPGAATPVDAVGAIELLFATVVALH